MCDPLVISALSTGIGFAQKQAEANAANAIQQQRAELNRRAVIAQYDTLQRQYQSERAQASRQQTEDALKALAARERARTIASARGVAQTSRSVSQTLAGISGAEGRANQARADALKELSADASDKMDQAHRSGASASLSNLSSPGPTLLDTAFGWANANSKEISKAINGADEPQNA